MLPRHPCPSPVGEGFPHAPSPAPRRGTLPASLGLRPLHPQRCARIMAARQTREAQKLFAELERRGVRLTLAEGRLVSSLPALIVKPYLMRANRTRPAEFVRCTCAAIVEPRRLVGAVPVGGLPDLAHPTFAAALPADSARRCEPVGFPRPRRGRMLEDSTAAIHRRERRREAPPVAARTIMFAAPAGEIHRRHSAPELARRMRDDRERASIAARVARFRPSIDRGITNVAAVRLHEERCNGRRNRRKFHAAPPSARPSTSRASFPASICASPAIPPANPRYSHA